MNTLQVDSESASALALAGELRVLVGKVGRRMRELSHPGDFTWSQKAVILRLERGGPATVSTLARAEGMRPQSMGATISTLEAAGLITGAPDPSDGRQTILSLTDACRQLLQSTRTAKQDWLYHAIRSQLTAEEQQQLAAAVELLHRLAES